MGKIKMEESLQTLRFSNDGVEIQNFRSERQKASESGGKIIWRGANAIMTAFFLMAAGVQFNDPDPFLWVPLYGTAAILTFLLTISLSIMDYKIWNWIYWMHAAYCIGMFVYVLVDLVIVATNPQSDGSLNPLTYEEGREMAGIMITMVWLFACKQTPNIRCKTDKSAKTTPALVLSGIIIFSIFPFLLWFVCYSNVMNSSYFSFCSDFYVEEFSF